MPRAQREIPLSQRKILDRPLTPASLQEIGVFESPPARSAGFSPDGNWQGTYRIWTCHGYVEGGNFDAGYLRLAKEAVGDTFQLHVEQRIALLDGIAHELEGVVDCRADTLATPMRCDLENRVLDGDGRPIDDLSGRYEARLEAGQWRYSANGTSGAIAVAGALSCDWSLFDAVQRLPFAPFEAEMDVLEHGTVLKRAQTLRYREDLAGRAGDEGLGMARFSRHGYATVPQEYWLDEQHRLVLAVAYNMAYILDDDAVGLYSRLRAERGTR